MSDLPAAPFEAYDQTTGRVSSQALVRDKTNDYSAPMAYGHPLPGRICVHALEGDVWIRGYVDAVVIGFGGEVIARHRRYYGREDMIFNPVHYLPLIDRERRMVERQIKAAKFSTAKSLDSFDFKAIPKLNKMQVLDLARCEWIDRRENVIALRSSGTGKAHIALGLGLAACQRGLSMGFIAAAALAHELMEVHDERRLLHLQKQMANYKLLTVEELGFVPLSKTGAELLFELLLGE